MKLAFEISWEVSGFFCFSSSSSRLTDKEKARYLVLLLHRKQVLSLILTLLGFALGLTFV